MTLLYSISARRGMPALVFFVMDGLLVCSNLILYYVRTTPALRHNLPDEMLTAHGGVYSSSFSSCSSFSGDVSKQEEQEQQGEEGEGEDWCPTEGLVSSEKERLIGSTSPQN
jgi:hypothetical protein